MSGYRALVALPLSLGLLSCSPGPTGPEGPGGPDVPPITTFSVFPLEVTVAPGQFAQASAYLVTSPGIVGSVAWTTSNPAIATVDGSGRIDGVSQGSAVVTARATAGGQSQMAEVAVTVRSTEPAQLTFQRLARDASDTLVDLGNVSGRVQVELDLKTGGARIDSILVFVGSRLAAREEFAISPRSGTIRMLVNTAHFTKDATAGTTSVDFPNGPTTLSAVVHTQTGLMGSTGTLPIVLNNQDGWAGELVPPTRTLLGSGNVTMYGGPGVDGLATIAVYPVIYTPGRTVASVSLRLGNSIEGCSTTSLATLPFRITAGYASAGADSDCTSLRRRDGTLLGPHLLSAIDNSGNPFPVGPFIPNSVVFGSTPEPFELDYQGPSFQSISLARTPATETGWVTDDFNFLGFVITDQSGFQTPRARTAWYIAPNCGGGAPVPMPTGKGADIPECATNPIGGPEGLAGTAPYRVFLTDTDRLGNFAVSDTTPYFGVRKRAP